MACNMLIDDAAEGVTRFWRNAPPRGRGAEPGAVDYEHREEKSCVDRTEQQVHETTAGEDACHERSVRSRAAWVVR
jgi:hypothetical protein